MTAARDIIVRCAPDGAGFDCIIRPAPVWMPLDAESLPTYQRARRKADCLKVVHPDWTLVDQVPKDRRAAA